MTSIADSLATAATQLEAARSDLTQWNDRTEVAERTYVHAGHHAVDLIDDVLAALYAARAALVTELRADEDERNARVDALLAQHSQTGEPGEPS